MSKNKTVIFAFLPVLFVVLIVAIITTVVLLVYTKDSTTSEAVLDNDVANYLATQLLSRVNFSSNPCKNFYEYACSHWKSDHPLPRDKSHWDAEMLISEQVGKEIVDSLKKIDLTKGSNGLKAVKTFYDKCMDVSGIEKQRAIWLGKLLHDGIAEESGFSGFPDGSGKWPIIDVSYVDPSLSIEKQIALMKSLFGIDTFIYTYTMENNQNATINHLWLTGTFLPLGMGEFSFPYYLDPKYSDIRKAYSELQHSVAQLLAKDSGFGNVQIDQKDLDGMLEVEIKLASMQKAIEEDDEKLRTIVEIEKLVPEFKWKDFFDSLLTEKVIKLAGSQFLLSEPSFVRELVALFKSTPRRQIQNYMIWRLVMYNLNFLSQDYKTAYNKFYMVFKGRNLTQQTQESICTAFIRGNYELPNLGFGAAEALVRTTFDKTVQDGASILTSNIVKALIEIIQNKEWMDDETKNNAKIKANQLERLIAFPEWVMNVAKMNEYYDGLKISNKVSFGTLNLATRSWAVRKNFDSIIILNTDRVSFRGSPVLTNAWYQSSKNSIVIPIGELHSPAFGRDYPYNLAYGALGALVGHEVSHGFFDPNGAEYDGVGNRVNWWSNSSRENFKKRQICLANQFSKYCYPSIGCVNGNQTLPENAADLAGLEIAYKAYKNLNTPQRLKKAPMFTSDQLFFLSFPLYFCGDQTDDSLRQQLMTDAHSPALFLVNGALRNMPQFSEAFGCPKNSYMNPDDRCVL